MRDTFRAVIFDMDGVLVNSEPAYFDRLMAFLKTEGTDPMLAEGETFVGASNKQIWERLYQDPSARHESFKRFINFEEEHPINYRPLLYKSVVPLLKYLQDNGVSIALASAGQLSGINQMLDSCNLRKYFDVVLSGENVAHNKPAPDIYLEALRKLSVNPSDALVIEDSDNGIAAAINANVTVWTVNHHGTGSIRPAANKQFKTLEELLEVISTNTSPRRRQP